MQIKLSSGVEFELEPDITVLVGASSMNMYGLLHRMAELPDVLFDDNVIVADGDELRVRPIFVDKNRWQIAVLHCPDAYIHPWRFHKLFEILQVASQHKRILLTTFSPLFLNLFEPRMVRVVERVLGSDVPQIKPIEHQSLRFRLAMEAFDGALGELWYTNHFGGNPAKDRFMPRRRDDMTVQELVDRINYCIRNPSKFVVVFGQQQKVLFHNSEITHFVGRDEEIWWRILGSGGYNEEGMREFFLPEVFIAPRDKPFAWWQVDSLAPKRREDMTVQELVDKLNYCIRHQSKFVSVYLEVHSLFRGEEINSFVGEDGELRWEIFKFSTYNQERMKEFFSSGVIVMPVDKPFAWWEMWHNEIIGNIQ